MHKPSINISKKSSIMKKLAVLIIAVLLGFTAQAQTSLDKGGEKSDLKKVTVFPNPVIDRVKIFCGEPTTIYIYNSFGKLVHQDGIQTEGAVTINMADDKSGLYMVIAIIKNSSGQTEIERGKITK